MNLDGIRILDLTQLLPGPYGSQLLADMGAEVIKVEPPEGDAARLIQSQPGWAGYVFSAVNNGKQSITIDLKTDEGTELFYDLVQDADVVFEQFRPGVAERLDIDYDSLTEHNDELIFCSLTGYGQDGPYENRAGHDLNYVGFAGLVEMTRSTQSDTPTSPGYPVADMTGGLMAVTSIVSALLSRELGNSGGEYIDISMTDAVLSYGQVEIAMADAGLDPRACETPITGAFPWYDIYETKDERYVTLAALEPRFWYAFCEAIDRPDLVEYHMTQDEEEISWLRDELADEFAQYSQEEWEMRLGEVDDSMFGLVKTPAEAIEDPHIQSRDILEETQAGHKRVRFPATIHNEDGPVSLSGTKTGTPDLGEHTESILAAHGLDSEEIEALRDADAI